MSNMRRRLNPNGALQRLVVVFCLVAGLAGAIFAQQPAEEQSLVLVAPVEGAIGPPTTRQIERLIDEGADRRAELVILQMDTPGGLATSTRDINKEILASPVPVAVYVAPSGARAASAGTYILYASHVAAMAPGTNLGAATPIAMGGGGPSGLPGGGSGESGEDGGDGDAEDDEGASGESDDAASSGDALARKQINDSVASIRSLAELRDRNADWAEAAVREGASLSASAALEQNVIEHVEADLDALLAAVDGRTVAVGGSDRTLVTAGAAVETVEPTLVTRLLGILSNPNVALLLMTLGFYGLIFELANPGLGPGIAGVICLLLGLYSLNLLPVDYAGLALIGIGLALMAAEAFTPAFGVLGVGGAVAFAIGAAIVVDTDVPAFQISWGVIGVVAGISLALVTLLLGAVVRTRQQKKRTGASAMIGAPAQVIDWADGRGHVRAHGERWEASGPVDLKPGETAEITRMEGLILRLRRPSEAENP